MEWFFRAGDTTRAKQVIAAIYVVLAVDVYGGSNRLNFTPKAMASTAAVIAAAVVTLLFVFAIWNDRNPAAPLNRYGSVRRVLTVLFAGAFFFGFTWMGFSYGVSAAITMVGGESSHALARVAAVFPERTGKGCHYQLQLMLDVLDKPVEPCVSQEIWRSSTKGDHVLVSLASGFLGTQIVDIEVVEGKR